jgi:hypothetical protein
VLYRDVQRGGVWWIIPHLVVSDDGARVMLYTSPGTPTASMVGVTEESFAEVIGGPRYALSQTTWEHNHALRILDRDAAHAVELYWNGDDWNFLGWYVHLQTPYRRTSIGFDKRDQALDILVDVDRRWSWKDEHHVDVLARSGYFGIDEVKAVWREAKAVVRRVEEWASPFSEGWESWRPDAAWADTLRAVSSSELFQEATR